MPHKRNKRKNRRAGTASSGASTSNRAATSTASRSSATTQQTTASAAPQLPPPPPVNMADESYSSEDDWSGSGGLWRWSGMNYDFDDFMGDDFDGYSDYDDSDDYSGWGESFEDDDGNLIPFGTQPYMYEPTINEFGEEREVANITGTCLIKIEKVEKIKTKLLEKGYVDKDIEFAIKRYKQRTCATFAENAILEDLKAVAGEPKKESHTENNRPSSSQVSTHGACVVCLDSAKETILIPCGHFCSCRNCAKHTTSCPVCRASVERVIRFFEV